jgi:glucokinase
MILAGDIGGTKTNLAFFEEVSPLKIGVLESFPSREHGSLDEIVREFVGRRGLSVQHACFGIAGPVKHGRTETTNLPWVVEASTLAQELGIATAWLINDLEANAYGIAALQPEDFLVLHAGAPDAEGNAAIIAAGTGLGEAGLYWDGERHHPFACEGGHADFAPTDDLETELLAWLRKQWEHVSWERVVSGPGLHNIYTFLRDRAGGPAGAAPPPSSTPAPSEPPDSPAAIAQAALAGTCPLCVEALDLCVRLYGAEAGNLALKVMATGGLYVGGGIAPKIRAKMEDGTFVKAFLAKGRMRPLLEGMPVRVILNDKTALLGAARCALIRSGSG